MHDPMTVAFEIKYPWKTGNKIYCYRSSFITIWHVDPELDGSDDSCGWAWEKRFREQDREWAQKKAGNGKEEDRGEWKFWFNPAHAEFNLHGASAFEIIYAAWMDVRHYVSGRRWYDRPLPADELQYVIKLASNWIDNIRLSTLEAIQSAKGFASFFECICRLYRSYHRPWWRHPRYHVRHWKVKIKPLQSFKRWAFTRCETCGKRFRWNESGITSQWHSKGPQWFKNQEGLNHMDCGGIGIGSNAAKGAHSSKQMD